MEKKRKKNRESHERPSRDNSFLKRSIIKLQIIHILKSFKTNTLFLISRVCNFQIKQTIPK